MRRGLARSRGEARDLVAAGRVTVAGRPAGKPAQPIAPDTALEVAHGPRWVGRGAHKLDHALTSWAPAGLSAVGRRCLDVGASTGGFTQVLLAAGACEVVALDVGHSQLADEVGSDPRVQDRSGTTVRGLVPDAIGGPAELVVADLSFISLTTVMADLVALMAPGADLVVLVKPQFEVGRARLSRTGLVTSGADRAAALRGVLDAMGSTGLHVHGVLASPLRGSTGNAEYLVWARANPSATMDPDRVRAAVRTVTARPTTRGAR